MTHTKQKHHPSLHLSISSFNMVSVLHNTARILIQDKTETENILKYLSQIFYTQKQTFLNGLVATVNALRLLSKLSMPVSVSVCTLSYPVRPWLGSEVRASCLPLLPRRLKIWLAAVRERKMP